ncbi:MAG: DUF5615 family PIN-like protein [Planctomycetes bacterium]|nr:DUF5615 family PIN-like protein [Planctomycetota bacterium]
MSQVAYLFDEHMPDALINAMVTREPSISILRIGQPGVPPKGTLDPQVIEFAERERLAIFTHDKSTMAAHAYAYSASGRSTFGVFIWTPELARVVGAASDLIMIWAASAAEEWMNRVEYLPFKTARGIAV